MKIQSIIFLGLFCLSQPFNYVKAKSFWNNPGEKSLLNSIPTIDAETIFSKNYLPIEELETTYKRNSNDKNFQTLADYIFKNLRSFTEEKHSSIAAWVSRLQFILYRANTADNLQIKQIKILFRPVRLIISKYIFSQKTTLDKQLTALELLGYLFFYSNILIDNESDKLKLLNLAQVILQKIINLPLTDKTSVIKGSAFFYFSIIIENTDFHLKDRKIKESLENNIEKLFPILSKDYESLIKNPDFLHISKNVKKTEKDSNKNIQKFYNSMTKKTKKRKNTLKEQQNSLQPTFPISQENPSQKSQTRSINNSQNFLKIATIASIGSIIFLGTCWHYNKYHKKPAGVLLLKKPNIRVSLPNNSLKINKPLSRVFA